MKKTMIIAASLIAAVAFGDIAVDWYQLGYVAQEDGSTYSPTALLCQLIYSDSAPSGTASTGGALLAGETLLDSTSAVYGNFASDGSTTYTEDYAAGYVYARVWNVSGTYYWQSDVLTGADVPEYTGVPSTITDAGFLEATDYVSTNVQAVPEPATALLFGIGAAGAWIVRRRTRIA